MHPVLNLRAFLEAVCISSTMSKTWWMCVCARVRARVPMYIQHSDTSVSLLTDLQRFEPETYCWDFLPSDFLCKQKQLFKIQTRKYKHLLMWCPYTTCASWRKIVRSWVPQPTVVKIFMTKRFEQSLASLKKKKKKSWVLHKTQPSLSSKCFEKRKAAEVWIPLSEGDSFDRGMFLII